MHRWIVFFSVWAITALASPETSTSSNLPPLPNDASHLPTALSTFPSQNDIKNPMPLNPEPWAGEGPNPLLRQNGTVKNARTAVAPPVYHGGKVVINPINIYIIWYGSWGSLTGDQAMINYFFNNIQSSAWWKLSTEYTQYKNSVTTHVTPNIRLAGSVQSPLSQGTSLASSQTVFNIVNSVLQANSLPADSNGLYFVLTAPNIAVTNYCVNFCGWHSGFNYQSSTQNMAILTALVPHPASSTSGATCKVNAGASSGFGFGASLGGYSMVNVIAHELTEAATDPIGTAWYRDSDHYENADICSWLFGPVQMTSNYYYNVQLGSQYFLIQEVFDLSTGRCAMAPGA